VKERQRKSNIVIHIERKDELPGQMSCSSQQGGVSPRGARLARLAAQTLQLHSTLLLSLTKHRARPLARFLQLCLAHGYHRITCAVLLPLQPYSLYDECERRPMRRRVRGRTHFDEKIVMVCRVSNVFPDAPARDEF
jgi:hypothetical protein